MEELGHWVQNNVPAEQLFLLRAILFLVVWVPQISHVIFSSLTNEGISKKVVYQNSLKKNWKRLDCSNANEKNGEKFVASIFILYSPFTENSMKGKTNHKWQDLL